MQIGSDIGGFLLLKFPGDGIVPDLETMNEKLLRDEWRCTRRADCGGARLLFGTG